MNTPEPVDQLPILDVEPARRRATPVVIGFIVCVAVAGVATAMFIATMRMSVRTVPAISRATNGVAEPAPVGAFSIRCRGGRLLGVEAVVRNVDMKGTYAWGRVDLAGPAPRFVPADDVVVESGPLEPRPFGGSGYYGQITAQLKPAPAARSPSLVMVDGPVRKSCSADHCWESKPPYAIVDAPYDWVRCETMAPVGGAPDDVRAFRIRDVLGETWRGSVRILGVSVQGGRVEVRTSLEPFTGVREVANELCGDVLRVLIVGTVSVLDGNGNGIGGCGATAMP
jgi:hypothetical protein